MIKSRIIKRFTSWIFDIVVLSTVSVALNVNVLLVAIAYISGNVLYMGGSFLLYKIHSHGVL